MMNLHRLNLHTVSRSVALLIVLLGFSVSSQAQLSVRGRVLEDAPGHAALPLVNVDLMEADDSSVVKTVETGNDGRFYFQFYKSGKYVVRLRFLGYETVCKNVEVDWNDERRVNLGDINLAPVGVELGEAQVTALSQMLTIKADTFVYHTGAFRLPPGATLSSLVQQIPGMTMNAEGKLTFHGREVSSVLVDGHSFFGDNTTALQNVVADAVKDVKIYEKTDEEKDFKGETDLDKKTVLDLTIKEEYKTSWNINLALAGGTHSRYSERVFASTLGDKSRLALWGQINNISEMNYSDGNGNWYAYNPGRGLYTYRTMGGTWSYDNNKRNRDAGYVEGLVQGELRHNDGHIKITSATENYVRPGLSHFSYGRGDTYNHNVSGSIYGELKWNLDTLNRLNTSLSFELEKSKESNRRRQSTFKNEREGNDRESLLFASPADTVGAVMAHDAQSSARNNSTEFSADLSFTHRFANRKNRNVQVSLNYEMSREHNRAFGLDDVAYFSAAAAPYRDLSYEENNNRKLRHDFSVGVVWSDALTKHLSYDVACSMGGMWQHERKPFLSFEADAAFAPLSGLGKALAAQQFFRENADQFLTDTLNSGDQRDKKLNSTLVAKLRGDWKKFSFYAAFGNSLTKENIEYARPDQRWELSRNYYRPYGDGSMRWKPSKEFLLQLRLGAHSLEPSMQSLLPISNTTDPTVSIVNNPKLKTSWRLYSDIMMNYEGHRRGESYELRAQWNPQFNAAVTTQTIDALTGHRTQSQTNVNGNYSTMLYFNTTQPLDSAQHWQLAAKAGLNYQRSSSFIGAGGNAEGLSRLGNLSWRVELDLSWCNDIWSIRLNASFDDERARFSEQPSLNDHGHVVDVKLSPQLNLPSGLRVSTSLQYYERFGYRENMLNHGQWLWNASVSQTFLKSKALSVGLQAVDILRERTSESNSSTPYGRSYGRTEAFLSYVLLNVTYHFTL